MSGWDESVVSMAIQEDCSNLTHSIYIVALKCPTLTCNVYTTSVSAKIKWPFRRMYYYATHERAIYNVYVPCTIIMGVCKLLNTGGKEWRERERERRREGERERVRE